MSFRGVQPAGKIINFSDLADVCSDLRKNGKRIVHCHGVFDLVHVGHARHLRAARASGDVLVVSVTADEFVNKGPGRPAFSAELRCEMLSSFDCVDYVTVIHEPSAVPAIDAIRPSVFVKGGEYDDPNKDITGKISREQKLVEKYGGIVKFTYDLTFSSSNLLNSHFDLLDPGCKDFLRRLRDRDGESLIFDFIKRAEKLKVVVIGETIIDRYVYVSPMGKAAKENIIATLHLSEEIFAGGVIAAANYLAAFCPNLKVVTMLGDTQGSETTDYELLVRKCLKTTVSPEIIYRPGSPTIEKIRFVEPTYVRKLFEVYRMDDRPLPPSVEEAFLTTVRSAAHEADLVVVCDFGHGFINKAVVDAIVKDAKFLALNVQTNAGNLGYNFLTKYPRADFLCIDAMEARLVSQEKHMPLENIVSSVLPKVISCPTMIVTHGKAGCFALGAGDQAVRHIPAFRQDVVDTVGAGDAFFATAAPFAALGADSELIGFMGNVAGAMKVGVIGHRESAQKLQLMRYVSTLLK